MKRFFAGFCMGVATICVASHSFAEESDLASWYLSPSMGMMLFEGDEEVKDGYSLNMRLGKDLSELLAVEAGIFLAPDLEENTVGHTELINGQVVQSRISQASADVAGFDSTYAVGLSLDGLYHFTRLERVDPYLALGVGATFYGEDFGNQLDVSLRGGGGVMYHINDVWALRVDGRLMLAGSDTEANATVDAGAVWHWGAGVDPLIIAIGSGSDDSDGDGLTDRLEDQIGTSAYDPDTDGDGLDDGEEHNDWKTDPLNPDTDYDRLSDGDEVHRYSTAPKVADTDKGGVDDGHEVLDDGTDPLVGADDLIKIELKILFDTDKAEIKPTFFGDLDVIGKVMKRHPNATAVIEGHADRRLTSKADYNMRLSQRRADAVMDYLLRRHKIDTRRLKAVGYGFSRPKVEPDLENGTPENRRVEVYIRNAESSKVELRETFVD